MENYNIGDQVKDKDGKICKIVDKTANSINVWIGKKGKEGVNCTNWFTFENFERRFKSL
jgi:hypothetical protein